MGDPPPGIKGQHQSRAQGPRSPRSTDGCWGNLWENTIPPHPRREI